MKAARRAVTALYLLLMAAIVADILLTRENPWPIGAKPLLLGQGTMLALGGAALFALSAASLRGEEPGKKRSLVRELLPWGALFIAQAVVFFFSYFITGWDARKVLQNAYTLAAYPNPEYMENSYYSLCPNNILLTEIYAAVIKAFRAVAGDAGVDRCAYAIVVFQCALNSLTGFLLCRVAEGLTGSRRFARATGVAYVAFIGISPWTIITYSDGAGLIFPVLLLYLDQRRRASARRSWPMLALMGAVAAVGFLLKPQLSIPLIAALLIEAAHALAERKPARVKGIAAACVAVALTLGPAWHFVRDLSLIEIEPGRDLGALHYMMMGLDERTCGYYSGEDALRSITTHDPDERHAMQIATIKERLQKMGPFGLLRHMWRKAFGNFRDGMFAWGEDGVFFNEMIEDKDGVLSPFFKSVFYGERYPAFLTYMQCLWMGLLAGGLLCGLLAARAVREDAARADGMQTLMLSLIGFICYVMLFEARARYAYTFSPLFLLAGMLGWRALASSLRGRARAARAKA